MIDFTNSIQNCLHSGEGPIDYITQYYFKNPGKYIRPTIALILSRVLTSNSEKDFKTCEVHYAQKVFAQVIEMIHCSSLIHDDVIDSGHTRRGQVAVHKTVGNKAAVMGGDYILSTASLMCTNLNDMRLVELISAIMENLARGELIQSDVNEVDLEGLLVNYCHKTYFKTAALIAHMCKGIGFYGQWPEKCFEFGKHLGMAFQYVDDILDFVGDEKVLGKPKLNDMKEGLGTGPVLLACEYDKGLLELVMRKFSEKGDIERGWNSALEYGIEPMRRLALIHLNKAMDALDFIEKDTFRHFALQSLATKIYNRVK